VGWYCATQSEIQIGAWDLEATALLIPVESVSMRLRKGCTRKKISPTMGNSVVSVDEESTTCGDSQSETGLVSSGVTLLLPLSDEISSFRVGTIEER
jgi:hypothetical protein